MLNEYRSRASFCPKRMRSIFEDEPSQAYRVIFFSSSSILIVRLIVRVNSGQY